MHQTQLIKPSTQTLLWFGLLGLVLIFVVAIMVTTIPLENRLLARTNNALKAEGYQRITVAVSGRDVVLTGAVGSRRAEESAKEIIAKLEGVRKVASSVKVLPIRLPHIKIVRAAGGSIVVTGELPNASLREQLQQLLNDQLPTHLSSALRSAIAVNIELAEPNWLTALPHALQHVQELAAFEIEVGANQLRVSGVVENREQYDAIVAALITVAEESDLKLVNQLAILAIKSS